MYMSFRPHPLQWPPPLAVWVGGSEYVLHLFCTSGVLAPPPHTALSTEQFRNQRHKCVRYTYGT
jgi:hypothetical protein